MQVDWRMMKVIFNVKGINLDFVFESFFLELALDLDVDQCYGVREKYYEMNKIEDFVS